MLFDLFTFFTKHFATQTFHYVFYKTFTKIVELIDLDSWFHKNCFNTNEVISA